MSIAQSTPPQNNKQRKKQSNKTSTAFKLKHLILRSGISRNLLLRFLIISILPMAFIAIESVRVSTATIKADQLKTLSVLEKSIHNHFSDYIEATITNIRLQAELANTIYFLQDLKHRFDEMQIPLTEFIKSHHWHNLQAQYGNDFSRFLTTYQYTDVMLLDNRGNILYTSHQYDDLGTNLFKGDFKHSKMATAAKQALETQITTYSDLQPYPPLGNQISGFIFEAIIDEDGVVQGLLAIHLDNHFIEKVMHLSTGLDEVGEAFLVGPDLLMRSNARFAVQPTVLKRLIDNPATQLWITELANKHAYHSIVERLETAPSTYINHDDIPVFGSYLPIDFAGVPLLIVTEVSQEKTLEPIARLTERLAMIVFATLALVIMIATYSARSITRPIIELTEWARGIAQGQLQGRRIKTPVNEIGVLNSTFTELVETLQEVVNNIEALSLGHIGQKLDPKSQDDVLVHSLNHLNNAMHSIVCQAETIANGSYVSNIEPRSDNDLLGNALVKMTSNLRKADLHNAEQDWIKTSQAELSKIINGDKDLDTLSNEVICYITKRVGGSVGTIYVVDYPHNVDTLILQAGYAIHGHIDPIVKVGEGIVGQAAKEQTFIFLQELPKNYLNIQSTLGTCSPEAVIIFPFCNNGRLSAVIEIASLSPIEEMHLEFIRLASESVAIAFKSCFIRIQTENLLEETQQQSEELKNQQEELRITNENLRTNTQTLQAQQKVLEKAQIQALEKAVALEEASKYKSEFLANMSHELRTPLNSLLILARSLSQNDQGNLSADEVQSAEVILDSGHHLLELINDVLDLSKIEAGQMTIHEEQVSIKELTGALHSRFKHMAEHKGIEFEIHVSDTTPEVIISDSIKLNQILTNLISNAIKFTDEGRVALYISNPEPETPDNDKQRGNIVFDVVDSGIGIAAAKQSDIFSAFVQEDGSTSRNYGGTGLGLSIVSSLATLLGGEISVESQPNSGSTFSFSLPLDSHQSSVSNDTVVKRSITKNTSFTQAAESAPAQAHTPVNQTFTPMMQQHAALAFADDRDSLDPTKPLILIIEDDPKFAKILYNTCHKLMCQAIITSDGETGLLMLNDYQIRGVILDYMLPGLDGGQILNLIKTNPSTLHIPVHVISALDNIDNMTNFGAASQTLKPITSHQLVTIIQSFLTNREASISRKSNNQVNLLIVEDDMSALFATRKLLQNENITNTGVGSGMAALEHLRLNAYDMMVLDLQLPDITGFELLETIDAHPAINMPKVIVYSGLELTEQEQVRLARYSDMILVKSTDTPKQLFEQVQTFISELHTQPDQHNTIEHNTVQQSTSENLLPLKQIAKQAQTQEQALTPEQKTDRTSKNEPEIKQAQQNHTSINDTASTTANSDVDFHHNTILLVDDDMRNTFALAKVLRQYNLNVKLASSGLQCLGMLDEFDEVELVLMDISMPQMDGFETMRRIRSQARFSKLPLIALTANAMPEDRNRCLDAGANDYLTKPVDIPNLVEKLKQWLSFKEG